MSSVQQLNRQLQGHVTDIQHYSVHDGPGIRTLVFLKGCPLRCKWCSNPETQRNQPELAYNPSKCIGPHGCSKCQRICPNKAISISKNERAAIDRNLCRSCFRCAEVCPAKALWVFGTLMSVEQVLDRAEAEGAFYARSGGGLTLSGGEPMQQPSFACALLMEAKRRSINTAMETCGLTDWTSFETACGFLDSILFDIKCIDSKKHEQFTGASNERILDNFVRLCEQFPNLPKLVRTPVIPGFNDSERDIQLIVDFLEDKPNVNYELLPYHRFGQPKYGYLGRPYSIDAARLDDELMQRLKNIAGRSNVIRSEANDARLPAAGPKFQFV